MTEGEFSWGKALVYLGLGLVALGIVALLLEKLGISWGRLPGDIHVEGDKGSFHFPVVTCIIISIVGTLLLNWFRR